MHRIPPCLRACAVLPWLLVCAVHASPLMAQQTPEVPLQRTSAEGWKDVPRWSPDYGSFVEDAANLWEDHKFILSILVILFLGQTITIITLFKNQRRRALAEEELREYQTRLEAQVQNRTAELSKALAAAQLADRTKNEFLANVSHELRTPLNAVIGLSSLAHDRANDAKQRDYLDKIGTSGRRLARIINDLLDLSKIAAGHMAFETIAFSLRQMILHSNSVMAHKAKEQGLTLVERVDDAVPDILVGDPLRLEQILLNLLSNAIKFTSSGGVEVHVSRHAQEEGRVCLEIAVADTGIGIRQEDLGQLFQPFSQADASMSRKYGGTGLGLAISRHLAEMMEGEITVETLEGSGTTFRVRVWLAIGAAGDQAKAESYADQETPPPCYRDARVLIVDDQAMNREIASELLDTVGITARMADNGQEALDILAETGPAGFDLILMDIQMPVMDGLTATRTIRARAGFAALTIIAMTAYTMKHEIEASHEAGMNDHIGKPFDKAGFYRILTKWLPRSKQQDQLASSLMGEEHATAGGGAILHGTDRAARADHAAASSHYANT